MTLGRIAFSPSSHNPRIPAPQRGAELRDGSPCTDGQRCAVPRPPLSSHRLPTHGAAAAAPLALLGAPIRVPGRGFAPFGPGRTAA